MSEHFTQRLERTLAILQQHQQEHVMTFYDDLDHDQQEDLLNQLESLNWSQLDAAIANYVLKHPNTSLPKDLRPAPYYARHDLTNQTHFAEARALGEALIAEGKIAAFTVAGGQGTRLGWDAPKGTVPATPISGKSLFQVFAEYIRKSEQKYDTTIPWYIMTSQVNDAETRAFFAKHDYFGLSSTNIMFFAQGMLPSLSFEGKLLLANKHQFAMNPDGHGGSLSALYRSGALGDMQARGIEHISYFQVDNPTVACIDPLFIGLHIKDEAQMSSKMLPKREAKERVGNFCLMDGRVGVIEYSDIPDELAEQRYPNGSLVFNAGSIAIHMIAVEFLRQLNKNTTGQFALPFHRAEKKVPYLDIETGEMVQPDTPNAVKLETFVFDALPLAETSIILETDRVEEFAPIKNADGQDSPKSSKQLQIERAARWLESCGVSVPRNDDGQPNAAIEISPLTAVEADDLKHVELPEQLVPSKSYEF